MRLTIMIDVEHDTLDVPVLLFAVPRALDGVGGAIAAGIAETGPNGMDVQPPGVNSVVKVKFKVSAHENVRRIADLVPTGDPP